MSTDDKPSVSMGCSVSRDVCLICRDKGRKPTCDHIARPVIKGDINFTHVSIVSTTPDGVSAFPFYREPVIDPEPPPSQVFSPADIEAATHRINVAEVEDHLDRFLHAVKGAQFVLCADRFISVHRAEDGVVTVRIAPVDKEEP